MPARILTIDIYNSHTQADKIDCLLYKKIITIRQGQGPLEMGRDPGKKRCLVFCSEPLYESDARKKRSLNTKLSKIEKSGFITKWCKTK
jgi:hypothetical protein